jgi:surfactin family lipopeptide synthetase A
MTNQTSFELDNSAEKQYWVNRLITNSETASFYLFDGEESNNQESAEQLEILLDKTTTFEINKLTKKSPVLNYTVFLSVLNICLFKYSANRLISLGHPVLKSNDKNNQHQTKLLLFQNNLNPSLTFKELLRQNQTYLKADYANQNYAFDSFQKDFDLTDQNNGSKLLRCILSFDKIHESVSLLKASLKISFFQENETFRVIFESSGSEVKRISVNRIANHFQNVLRQVITNPEIIVSEIIMPDEDELNLIIGNFNQTAGQYLYENPVYEIFENKAEENPENIAITLAGFTLTYSELNKKANQLSHFLINSGVKAETTIGIAFERSIETVISILGIMKAGAAFLPVDMQNPAERLGYILDDCRADFLLTKKPYFDFLSAAAPDLKIICFDEANDEIEKNSNVNPNVRVFLNQSAYVIYTSGSTGFPKGVIVEHGGLTNYVNWCMETYPMQNQLTMLHSPLSFDLTITSIFPPLLSGKTIEIIPELPSIEGLAQSLSTSNKYNLLKITPSHLQLLSEAMKKIQGKLNLNCLVIGGEALKSETISFWKEKYPEIRCFNEYGPTETVVGCCVFEITDKFKGNIPIGKPIYNQKLYVLDEFLNPVPQNVAGEIYISGKALARGYNQKADFTAERFIPNPFGETFGERMYQTGDIGRINSDLNLEYLGRTDNQVKIRGFRIELNEIEFSLSLFPDVIEATVAVKEDPLEQKRIVGYMVMEDNNQATPELKEVRQVLRQSLPEYMLPSAIVRLDSLPLTNNGKIDKNALPEPNWKQISAKSPNASNITEELLVGIWSEILGVSDISIEDNFFELGGHSLLATRVVARIREVWKTELEITRFFENPTIKAISRWLDNNQFEGQIINRPPIKKRELRKNENTALLSYAQHRLWFLEQLNPGSPLYNVQLAIKLKGNLNINALQKSLNDIIQRHEILRSSFFRQDNDAIQIVNELKKDIEIPILELEEKNEKNAIESIKDILTREVRKGFNLSEGNLIRIVLIKTSETDHIAVMTVHHIVFDGWSTAILVQEIGELYRSHTTGTKPNLPELKIQYADFANWERNWLQGEVLEKQLDYWRKQLAGIPAYLDLPTDKPRPQVQSINGDVVSLKFEENLVTALKKLSQNESATLFMTLMAALRALLYRYTGQNDILIGTPVAGRISKELENLIGIFINNLVLRGFVTGNMIFNDLITNERETALAAFSHQDVSFEKIVEDLNPERNLGHAPIFQVMLTLQNMAIGTLELGDISMSNVEIPSAGARYDLALWLVEVSGQITCSIEYNLDLFYKNTVTGFIRHFKNLLTEISKNSNLKVADINLIDEKEKLQIVYNLNDTDFEYNQDEFICSIISKKAVETPESIAVNDGTSFLTYKELERCSDEIAARLIIQNYGRESVIAICLDRSVNMIAAILGIQKAGASYLPLDPVYPTERLLYMIKDSEAPLLITQKDKAMSFKNADCEVLLFDSLLNNKSRTLKTDSKKQNINRDNLAYLIYTSGSTGKPKGTMVSHSNLLHSTKARSLYYKTKPDVYLLLSSFSFDSSVAGIFWTLSEGGTLVIPPAGFEKDPESIGELIKQHRVTILLCLPSVYSFLMSNFDVKELISLKIVIVAGEPCSNELVKKHSQSMPLARLYNEYGPTEASVWSTACELTEADSEKIISIGKPIPNSKVYILDENLQVVPFGVSGSIFIGGNGVSRGYFKRPDLTAEKFIPDFFAGKQGQRLYKTGDIGRYRSDGSIDFFGREDEQIKIRGYRIELGEIESAIKEIEGIQECVIITYQDSSNTKKLAGYFVVNDKSNIAGETIKVILKETLPDFMIPQTIQEIKSIPRSPNGKINRNALPKPSFTREQFSSVYIKPTNQTEIFIAKIWTEVLEIDRIGINDNFFDLGGHSFLVIKVHDKIQKQFDINFPLIRLFEFTTVKSLASFLNSQNQTSENEISYEDWAKNRKRFIRSRIKT